MDLHNRVMQEGIASQVRHLLSCNHVLVDAHSRLDNERCTNCLTDWDALLRFPLQTVRLAEIMTKGLLQWNADVLAAPQGGLHCLGQRIAEQLGDHRGYPVACLDLQLVQRPHCGSYRAELSESHRCFLRQLREPARVVVLDGTWVSGHRLEALAETFAQQSTATLVQGVVVCAHQQLNEHPLALADQLLPLQCYAELGLNQWKRGECPHCAGGVAFSNRVDGQFAIQF